MHPSYFVLCGLNAYTTSYRPSKIYFEDEVNLRGLNHCIKLVSIRPQYSLHKFTCSINPNNLYVYKSNLQKCVRRQLCDKAIRSAYALMSIDCPTLLRRLPIVMIEDVLPHPSLIPLAWWMMATTKGYDLSDEEVSYILGVVYMLCECKQYQVKNISEKGCVPIDSNLPQISKDLLWALEFRKAYGGMHCDRLLIESIQRGWGKRMADKDELWEAQKRIPVTPIDLTTLGDCDKSDIILEAIDQHCFSWIPSKLQASFPQYTTYQIKGAIWFYRSRLNKRELCHGSDPVKYVPELEPIYLEIRDQLESLCLWVHSKLL